MTVGYLVHFPQIGHIALQFAQRRAIVQLANLAVAHASNVSGFRLVYSLGLLATVQFVAGDDYTGGYQREEEA
jgi:hypothetical protein